MRAREQLALIEDYCKKNFVNHDVSEWSYQLRDIGFKIYSPHVEFAENMQRAFARLRVRHIEQLDFEIFLADTTALKISLPRLDWGFIEANGYRGCLQDDVFLHYFPTIRALSCIDLRECRAYYVVQDGGLLPWWYSPRPIK